MVFAMFVLALLLLGAGGAGFVFALNLIPTELGFAYFQASSNALVAGVIVLALALAARMFERQFKTFQPYPSSQPVQGARVAPPALDGMQPAGTPAEIGTGALVAAGALATGVVAAGTLAGGAGSQADRADDPEGPGAPTSGGAESRELAHAEFVPDDFERDLFGTLQASGHPDAGKGLDAPQASPPPVTVPADEASLGAIADFSPAPSGHLHGEVEALVPVGDEAAEPANVSDVEPESAPASNGTAETSAEATALPEPGPGATAGLIHDADFAAVADEAMPPLAPLATLEAVGSYDSAGTRFTMYSDGSVVAAGPEGEQRFRSLEELRAYIDTSAKAPA